MGKFKQTFTYKVYVFTEEDCHLFSLDILPLLDALYESCAFDSYEHFLAQSDFDKTAT